MKACDLLQWFKDREAADVEGALVLASDKRLALVVSVWGKNPITPPHADIEITCGLPEESALAWRRLWEATEFRHQDVADLAGMNVGQARSLVERAIGLRLVYPDGTIHAMARKVLQQRLREALNIGRKGRE